MVTRKQLETVARNGMEQMFARVPRAREFHAGTWMEEPYYIRYLIEIAKRIPLMNASDAYALYTHGTRDPVLRAKFAHYLAEEWGGYDDSHDHSDLVFQIVCRANAMFGSDEMSLGYLRQFTTFVAEYFDELYHATSASSERRPVMARS